MTGGVMAPILFWLAFPLLVRVETTVFRLRSVSLSCSGTGFQLLDAAFQAIDEILVFQVLPKALNQGLNIRL